jgi:hypothetical protein
MDLFSARWDDLQVDGRPCSYLNMNLNISRPQAPARRPSGVRPRDLRMLSRDRNQHIQLISMRWLFLHKSKKMRAEIGRKRRGAVHVHVQVHVQVLEVEPGG